MAIRLRPHTYQGKRNHKAFRPQSRHYSDVTDRVRHYILNRNVGTKTEYWKTHVTKEEIAEALRVKVHLVEHALQQLNIEGLVSQPTHKPPHDCKRDRWGDGCDNSWGADTYTIYDNTQKKETVHSLFAPPYDYAVSRGSLGHFDHSYLIGLYNMEKHYINQVTEMDIRNWDWKTKKRRSELLDKIILKSKILCCYLIRCNESIEKDEYKKLIGVISEDYIASFWAVMHLKNLSHSDRKRLVEVVANTPAFSIVYLNLFSSNEERRLIIKKILYSGHLNLLYDFFLASVPLFGDEIVMFIDRIVELNDMDLAVQAYKNFGLGVNSYNKISPLLVAAKLMGRLKNESNSSR